MINKGTEVVLLLPAGEASAVPAVVPADAPKNGTGEHVLIVEDMVSVSALVAELLSDAGYRSTQVHDAEGAVQRRRPPGLSKDQPRSLRLRSRLAPGAGLGLAGDELKAGRPWCVSCNPRRHGANEGSLGR